MRMNGLNFGRILVLNLCLNFSDHFMLYHWLLTASIILCWTHRAITFA